MWSKKHCSDLSRELLSLRLSAILSLLFLSTMFIPQTLNAQASLPPLQTSIKLTLPQLKQMTTLLMQRLTARIADSEILSAQLVMLKEQVASLQSDLLETSTSLDKSIADFKRLSNDFDIYVTKANDDLAAVRRERDAAIIIAKTNGICFKVSLCFIGAGFVYEAGHNDWNLGPIHFKKIW
jgi:hypothetical protein